jgi:hypothetical protein
LRLFQVLKGRDPAGPASRHQDVEGPQVRKAGLALPGCALRRNLKSQIEETKSQEPKSEIRKSKSKTRNGRNRNPKKVTLSEKEGAEMGAKRVILGGFGREKRGQKGEFGASKAGK